MEEKGREPSRPAERCRLAKVRGRFAKGRARYRSIDDRARYWEFFFLFGKMKLENFQRKKKKKRIMSGLEPMLIP